MKEDLHHLTLTDHQLELLAIAYQTAIHRTIDDHMISKMGDLAFITSLAANQDTFDQDWDDLKAKIIAPVHNRIKAMPMGEKYI